MVKKVLFLDVDGVLNKTGTRERSPHGTYGVEQELVMHLRHIIHSTEANIVMSSAWRNYPDMMEYMWKEVGEDIRQQCLGKTDELWNRERGHEIARWLEENPTETFVILDDSDDMATVRDHFIQTDYHTGITAENAEEAIRRLNEKD